MRRNSLTDQRERQTIGNEKWLLLTWFPIKGDYDLIMWAGTDRHSVASKSYENKFTNSVQRKGDKDTFLLEKGTKHEENIIGTYRNKMTCIQHVSDNVASSLIAETKQKALLVMLWKTIDSVSR